MDRDLSRSRAILIGNSVFDDPAVADLRAVAGCVPAMRGLLRGPLCGWPRDKVATLLEEPGPSEVAVSIVDLLADVRDVVLIYYAGHGMRTSEGDLALALRKTVHNYVKLTDTALLYKRVASILQRCPAATKLVILDCCHAELANKDSFQFQSLSASVVEPYPVDGLYFIGASARNEKAKSPVDGGLTYFTQALIDVVRSGIPHRPATLRLDKIFVELRARPVRNGLPMPVEAGTRGAYQYPFAINAAPAQEQYDPEIEIERLTREREAAAREQQRLEAEILHLRETEQSLRRRAEEDRQLSVAERDRLNRQIEEIESERSAAAALAAQVRADQSERQRELAEARNERLPEGGGCDADVEAGQFAVDPAVAPGRIFLGESQDPTTRSVTWPAP